MTQLLLELGFGLSSCKYIKNILYFVYSSPGMCPSQLLLARVSMTVNKAISRAWALSEYGIGDTEHREMIHGRGKLGQHQMGEREMRDWSPSGNWPSQPGGVSPLPFASSQELRRGPDFPGSLGEGAGR